MRLDAHQHFWKFDPVKDAWITDDMKIIQRDFMPEDLYPSLKQEGLDGCIAVQADQSENETLFLLELADKYEFIKGVVGWVDLCAADVGERLEYFSAFSKLKGFRHIVQGEPQDDFLLRKDFCRGISLLRQYDFTYDILIHPRHLKYALEFIKLFPDQPFVIDHLAKPFIREHILGEWKTDISAIADISNVHCKISGMVTEADWKNWKADDFAPYTDAVIESFGPDRIMFGSDWPVCLVAASYTQVCEIAIKQTDNLSENEQEKFWGLNAERFYNR
ncbi:MAG: amidohydrolase family protein [Chitinophagaceae bacterium]